MIYFIKGKNSNMKKIALYAAVLSLSACSAFSWGSKESSSSSEIQIESSTENESQPDEFEFIGPFESDEILIIKANAKAASLSASMEKFYDYSLEGGYKLKDGISDEEVQNFIRIYEGVYFAANRYIKAHLDCDPKAYVDSIFPANLSREYKSTSVYEDFSEQFISHYKGVGLDEVELSILSLDIEIGEKLSDSEIRDIETHISDLAHSLSTSGLPPRITEGYSFSATAKTGTESVNTTHTYNLAAINFGNEVWKIVEEHT